MPKVSLFGGKPIYSQYYKSILSNKFQLIIGTTMPEDPVQHVRITIVGITDKGTYFIGAPDYDVLGEYDLNAGRGNPVAKRFDTHNVNVGSVTISKLDTVNKIVSGRFEFEVKNVDDQTETLKISRGRFDLRYNQ